jgi:hypothetical protein
MTTIPIEVSTEQLLRAVERLPAQDLEAFVAQVIALRAQRNAPSLRKKRQRCYVRLTSPWRLNSNNGSTNLPQSDRPKPSPLMS